MANEKLNGHRCDKCACWVRLTDDEKSYDYQYGYCKYAPPVVIVVNEGARTGYPMTSYEDGCMTEFVAIMPLLREPKVLSHLLRQDGILEVP